jgi:hypothetical protein
MKTLIPVLFACFFFSCARNTSSDFQEQALAKMEAGSYMAPPPVQQPAATQNLSDRRLIKTGHLNIVVENVDATKNDIASICKEFDAFISSETQTGHDDRLQYEQVIRIPSKYFDAFVKRAEAMGREVKSKNIQTEDVTEEFIDKEARIKTKKELENRYRDILTQAKKVSDILSIEEELNKVRSDIESMEGRLNYLRNQVAFSTLALTFYEPIGTESGFGTKTAAAFNNGWDILLVIIIGVVNLWPFWFIGAGALYLIYRKNQSGKNTSSAGQDAT